MDKHLDFTNKALQSKKIAISGSKSESNRMLILKEFYPNITLKNLSNSKDTQVLQKALNSKEKTIDIGHTGTAMRFLTAFYAAQNGKTTILTGSERMQKRPIKILVDALKMLGADITYLKNEGFPPLKINGKTLEKDKISIAGNVSSQYISALLLLAPSLKNGLKLTLLGEITSIPYIKMTLNLLDRLGISTGWHDNTITVKPQKNISHKSITIESDWSSASYFYSLIALSGGDSVSLSTFFTNSIQGDSELASLYTNFGVTTIFKENLIFLSKTENFSLKKHLKLDLNKTPDLAQTIAVTCVGLGISCTITGLHTLKIKETDRLVALKNELQKLGAAIKITDDSIQIKPKELKANQFIETYDDHRMAMAFAPLALKTPIIIKNPSVVDKSYPDFWKDFQFL